ncbi:MAG: YitT family protein [Clostridiaceae bacterium]|nr:YitT family protein [Clostridiaceae bacterium]
MIRLNKGTWRTYLFILLGCLIVTIAMNLFLIPFKIAPGGVSGLSTVIHHLMDGKVPVGLLMFAFNLPLFLSGYKSRGRSFLIRSLFGAVALSSLIDITSPYFKYFTEFITEFDTSMAIPDLLLNSIVGGFIMGIGLGIILKENATTGGTDLAAAILKKLYPRFSMGQYLLFLDGLVILFATIAFRSVKLGLYAAFSLYISTITIDAYLEGLNFAKGLLIISDHSDQIAQRLLHDVDRGVTGLKGMGMYSGKDKLVLLCVVKREEIGTVRQIVKEYDPNAFILLIDVREVLGEGFQPLTTEE